MAAIGLGVHPAALDRSRRGSRCVTVVDFEHRCRSSAIASRRDHALTNARQALERGDIWFNNEMLMLRMTVFTILLLTGCDKGQVKDDPAVGQSQQIESPLQNTVEGMAKAKALDLERGRLAARRF
jgi:hypothetical protein